VDLNEHSRKGSRGQLIGINLWVVSVFLGFLAFSAFKESPIGFLLLFIVIVLLVWGLIRVYAGSYHLLKGTPPTNGRWMVNLSIMLSLSSPLIALLGIFSFPPVNYILIQLALWFFLSSFVLPYMRRGGMVTGFIALTANTVMGGVILSFILFADISLPISIPAILGAIYFLFLEITIFGFYLRALESKEFEDLPEYDGKPDALAVRTTSVPGPIRMRVRKAPNPPRTAEPLSDLGQQMDQGAGRESEKVTSFEDFVKEMGDRAPPPPTPRPEVRTPPPPPPVTEKKEAEIPEQPEVELDMTHVLIDGEDLYSILRVGRQAEITELRKAYRKRALLYHPDLNREVGDLYRESINEEMRKLNKAKEVLFDHRKRAEYDRRLRRFESGV
jgi:hypothetical protein